MSEERGKHFELRPMYEQNRVPFNKRCNTRRSSRNGAPLCRLEAGHKGEHYGYKRGSIISVWWEDKKTGDKT